jgi:hypothetical protein
MNLRRLFLLAMLLPAAIFLVDQWTLSRYDFGQPSLLRTLVLYALFVGQVGVLGWTVGRWCPHPVLCWAVYAWGIALVDVSCFRAAVDDSISWWGNPLSCLIYAFASAQIGMIVTWTILTTSPPWQWRLPGFAIVASALGYFCLCLTFWSHELDMWVAALLVQSIVVVILSGFLRVRGFRLERYPQSEQSPDAARRVSYLQFSIGDMLLWTAATVPVLLLAKELDWLQFLQNGWDALPIVVMLGIGFAAVALVGMWAGLGQGSLVVRLAVLGAAAPAVGALLEWMPGSERVVGSVYRLQYHFLRMAAERVGFTWMAWTSLAGGFLAATLLIFRARGYRLVRKRRRGVRSAEG